MANERPPPLWTLIFLQWTFLQNKPSQLPPSLYKRTLSSFVLQTCLWSVTVCLFQIAMPMLFLKNSILLAELLTSFFQRADISWCQKWDLNPWGTNNFQNHEQKPLESFELSASMGHLPFGSLSILSELSSLLLVEISDFIWDSFSWRHFGEYWKFVYGTSGFEVWGFNSLISLRRVLLQNYDSASNGPS